MKKLSKLDESKLFGQLNKAVTNDDTASKQLVANVCWVVKNAQIISDQIVRRLPQYTLHNGTHLFNVLSIMEELLPEETLRALTPLECALCILAAFTHDLGMMMLDEDIQKYQETTGTPENQEWRRHCDAYPEERRQIERWEKSRDRESEANRRISYLEGHLLAEFIRKRHADKLDPILHWLNWLEEEAKNQRLFYYGNFNFKRYLAQIGVSHGQRVSWLRETLVQGGKEDSFCRLADGERANLAFPGLLVRLADIMDFDASRAPGILYRHFGIENDVSTREWEKHMAITGWDFGDDTLTYEADACENPVYEKTIRDSVNAIGREVKSVKEELNWQRRLLSHKGEPYQLRLPEFVQSRIRAALDGQGRPVYVFHDLQFDLDQYEIQQLLMGESLYADPTLCLRELLQNALDALQMRDLRLKVLEKDSDARVEPTNALRPDEVLQIKVTWGRDSTDREYIRILDNGCGMTREVLEHYFTKLGKSYYRSPEYERERQILREHGFIVSPISQFGIGFLSCFMLADKILIRTHPGQANDGVRAAYDVCLSGFGNLFWLAPGTLERQGTEITLYLKQPFQLDHDRERAIRWLKAVFGYLRQQDHEEAKNEWQEREKQKFIDPLWIIGRHIVWPMFPINIGPASDESLFTSLNNRFHLDILEPIAIGFVEEKAIKCDFEVAALGQPRWEFMDWEDNYGQDATGTRIRIIFPYHQSGDSPCLPLDSPLDGKHAKAYELAALVESVLDYDGLRSRDVIGKRLTVKGINMGGLTQIYADKLPIAYGVGTLLWIDLRGDAAPYLTVDRKTAMPRDDVENWPQMLYGILQRWCAWLQSLLDQHSSRLAPNLLSVFAIEPALRLKMPVTPQISNWQLNANCRSVDWVERWLIALLTQEFNCISSFPRDCSFKGIGAYGRGLSLAFQPQPHDIERNPAYTFCVARDMAIALINDFVFSRDNDSNDRNNLVRTIAQSRVSVRIIGFPSDRDNSTSIHEKGIMISKKFAQELVLSNIHNFICLESSVALHLLPEAFASDLSRSLPALGICGLKGRAGDGWLVAPGWIEWDVDPVTAEVRRESSKQHWSQPLIDNNYDLVFPLTNIPLGRLRRDCPKWRSDRSYRALGVLAYFLLGSEEWFKEQGQNFLDLLNVPHIHALMPKPELWLKPFDEWTEADWNTCGLSALWDIESGVVYWAEGAHKADDMKRVGKPIEQFIVSKT
jgi:hypothetical protein